MALTDPIATPNSINHAIDPSLNPSQTPESLSRRQSFTRRQSKDRKTRIRQTFLILSSATIVLLIGLLVYWNYLLLEPHLNSLCWAILVSMVLRKPHRLLLSLLQTFEAKISGYEPHIIGGCLAIVFGIVGLHPSLVTLIAMTSFMLFIVLILYSDKHQLVSLFLVLSVAFIVAFPCVFFFKTAVDETQEFVMRTRAFVTTNPDFDLFVKDFTQSGVYKQSIAWAESFGYSKETIEASIDVQAIKDKLTALIGTVAGQLMTVFSSALNVIASLSNAMVFIISFFSFLYGILESQASFGSAVTALSPFSAEENVRLTRSITRTASSVFVTSICIGLLHFGATFIAFRLVDIDFALVLSLCAGFSAMLPVFSSWLIFLPAIIGKAIVGNRMQAGLLICIQLFLVSYLDPLLYSSVQGNRQLMGLSIVLGLASFGASGVILAPILVTLTFTLASIYVEYVQHPTLTTDVPSSDHNASVVTFETPRKPMKEPSTPPTQVQQSQQVPDESPESPSQQKRDQIIKLRLSQEKRVHPSAPRVQTNFNHLSAQVIRNRSGSDHTNTRQSTAEVETPMDVMQFEDYPTRMSSPAVTYISSPSSSLSSGSDRDEDSHLLDDDQYEENSLLEPEALHVHHDPDSITGPSASPSLTSVHFHHASNKTNGDEVTLGPIRSKMSSFRLAPASVTQ